MPVGSGRWLSKTIADVIALVDLDRRSRSAAVEAPEIESLPRHNVLLYRFGNQMEDLVHHPS